MKKLLVCCFAFSPFILLANELNDTTAAEKRTNEITKLEDCKLPQHMYIRIKKMGPADIASLREELQQPIRDEDGEKLLTIKLRVMGDNIIGIMKEAPINHSDRSLIMDKRINIPVKWNCTPDSANHEMHTVLLSQIKNYETSFRCKNWKQEEPEEEPEFGKPDAPIPVKRKKKKLFGLFKN